MLDHKRRVLYQMSGDPQKRLICFTMSLCPLLRLLQGFQQPPDARPKMSNNTVMSGDAKTLKDTANVCPFAAVPSAEDRKNELNVLLPLFRHSNGH